MTWRWERCCEREDRRDRENGGREQGDGHGGNGRRSRGENGRRGLGGCVLDCSFGFSLCIFPFFYIPPLKTLAQTMYINTKGDRELFFVYLN